MERVKSADVLDATHEAKRPFRGVVLGYFRRMGPNTWDDYQFVRSIATDATKALETAAEFDEPNESVTLQVLPRVPLQLEARGAEIRIRSSGRVVRVRWLAEPADVEAMGARARPREIRRYFVEQCLSSLTAETKLGAGVVIAKRLSNR